MSRDITRAQRDWLEGELAAWQGMGLVDAGGARAILDAYETPASAEARRRDRGLLTLLALAATFVGLGVMLLIGYNWEQMPAAAKVAAIFCALVAAHAGGAALRYRAGWRRAAEVAFFLGCLFFGAAIFLLAQIFHISSDNYDGLWWWAVGTLPLAVVLDSLLLHLLFAAILATWVGFEVLPQSPFFWGVPRAAYSVPLLLLPGFWRAYRVDSARLVGIYVPVLAWWVVLLPIAWRLEANPAYLIGAIGALLLLISAMHPERSAMAIPYRLYGTAIVGGALIPLSFHEFYGAFRDGPRESAAIAPVLQMVVILILAALTLIAAYFLQKRAAPDAAGPHRTPAEAVGDVLRRQAVPLLLLGMFAFIALWEPLLNERWGPTIAANAAMLLIAFWLIRIGLAEDRGRPFGAGVCYLLLWSILRYVDLFGAFGGMLGAALMFFLCGASLLGVALFWRGRKAVSLG